MSAIKLRFYQIPGGEMTSPQPNDLFAVERATDRVAQFIKFSTLQTVLGGGGGGGGAVASVNGATGVVVLNTDAIQEAGSPTNKWYTDARVRACLLTGINTSAGAVITASDSILSALGKLEFRTNLNDAKVGYADSLVRAATLTGLNTALTGAVAAGDTILAALGKLEHRMAINDAKDTSGNMKLNADNALAGLGMQWTNTEVGSGPQRFWHFDSEGGTDDGQAAGIGGGTSNGGYDGALNPSLISRIGIAETLVNKTLTQPTINGATLNNPDVSGNMHGNITFDGVLTFVEAVADMTLNSPTINAGILASVTASGIWLGQINADGGSVDTKFSIIANTLGEYNFGYRDGSGEWIYDGNLIMRRGDLPDQIDSRINSAWKGFAGGFAPLDGGLKIPVAYLPDTVLGQLEYQNTWNATTNTPTIPTAASGNKGWYYIVNVAGSTSISGITDWKVGDWLVSNGASWDKVDNTDAVSTVNGQAGAVTLNSSHISEVTNLYFTEARVRASLLTGLSTGTGGAVAAGDSVLSALGKLENRTALNDAKVTYADASVRACVLTGLSTASTAAVTASDSILVALGRHEARMVLNDAKTGYTDALVRACVLTGYATAVESAAVIATDTILAAFGKLEFRVALNDAKVTGSDRITKAGDTGVGSLSFSTGAVITTDRIEINDETVTYAASVNIDLATANWKNISLTGNISFATTNRAARREIRMRIICDSTLRTFTFPAWKWLGGTAPANIGVSKTGVLALRCWGTNETDVHAQWIVEP